MPQVLWGYNKRLCLTKDNPNIITEGRWGLGNEAMDRWWVMGVWGQAEQRAEWHRAGRDTSLRHPGQFCRGLCSSLTPAASCSLRGEQATFHYVTSKQQNLTVVVYLSEIKMAREKRDESVIEYVHSLWHIKLMHSYIFKVLLLEHFSKS